MKKAISDMYLVATLLASEVPYLDIEEQGSGRKEFIFDGEAQRVVVIEDGEPRMEENVDLDRLESYHASGNLFVSSDRLCAAIRNVKSLIHART